MIQNKKPLKNGIQIQQEIKVSCVNNRVKDSMLSAMSIIYIQEINNRGQVLNRENP